MPTRWNVAVQVTSVVVFVILRTSAPGWWLLIFVLSVIGPVLMLVPLGMAIATVRRRRLSLSVAVPFAVTAACLVLAGALIPDFGDSSDVYFPLVGAVPADAPAVDVLNNIGFVALYGVLGGLVWTIVALLATRAARRNTPPGFPAHG